MSERGLRKRTNISLRTRPLEQLRKRELSCMKAHYWQPTQSCEHQGRPVGRVYHVYRVYPMVVSHIMHI